MREIEETWWNQWITEVFSHLVPFRRWKHERRNARPGDIVLVMYEKRMKKGDYRLGRILAVHPDCKGIVRTVTVGLRKTDAREKLLPYVPKKLQELTKVGIISF